MVNFGKILHFGLPSTCKIFESAIIKEVFKSVIFNISNSVYLDLPENTVGQKIRKLRLTKNLTQLEFAKSLHKGYGTITKWEQGLTFPYEKNLSDIISIYHLDKNYFNLDK